MFCAPFGRIRKRGSCRPLQLDVIDSFVNSRLFDFRVTFPIVLMVDVSRLLRVTTCPIYKQDNRKEAVHSFQPSLSPEAFLDSRYRLESKLFDSIDYKITPDKFFYKIENSSCTIRIIMIETMTPL